MQVNLSIEDAEVLVGRGSRNGFEAVDGLRLSTFGLNLQSAFILDRLESILVLGRIPGLSVDFGLQTLLHHLLHFDPLCLLVGSFARFISIFTVKGVSGVRWTMVEAHLLPTTEILRHLHRAIWREVSLEIRGPRRMRENMKVRRVWVLNQLAQVLSYLLLEFHVQRVH